MGVFLRDTLFCNVLHGLVHRRHTEYRLSACQDSWLWTRRLWVALACWDSKKKRAFVWLCPIMIFGSDAWFDTFKAGMQTNDYMFCELDCPRGTPLGSIEDKHTPLYKPSTPYMVQKRIRELYLMPRVRVDGMASDTPLEPLMDAEAAASTTRLASSASSAHLAERAAPSARAR